jgi:hypothetical protein
MKPLVPVILATLLSTLTSTIASISIATAQKAQSADVLIQAGHEGRPNKYSTATGAVGKIGKRTVREIDWTPIVANEATRILRDAGVSVIRVNADEIRGKKYNVKDAVFIHFDGSNKACSSGASIGYDDNSDKPAADVWKALYKKYWPYKFNMDNFTTNLSQYYGFASTVTSDAELVLELGEITCETQAKWLEPRLKWHGRLIAHFLSKRINKGKIPDPGSFKP